MKNTRRQHYVWRSYLGAWATDEKIFCLQDGRIFQPNISGVAVERDFYRLQAVTSRDIEGISLLIAKGRESSRRVKENFIAMFAGYVRLKENPPPQLIGDEEFQKWLDHQIINAEEEFHSRIEGGINPILNAIKNRDLSFYSDAKLCGQFMHFLSLQYFRTKGVKDRILARTTEQAGFSLARCWNILSHIFAVNVGASLLGGVYPNLPKVTLSCG
jgi:hypothetical protein